MADAASCCPPADVIAAFALGELPAARAPQIRAHVSECDICLQTVAELARSGRTASEADRATLAAPAENGLYEPGTVIGSYRLVQRLGEGGMGEVWQAEQLAPVRRTVAVKLVKPGMDTRQIIARFESERQALAIMQHPGIAQMFEAGVTPGGRPYFVMEYVDGKRVTDYCDENRLGLRDRLALFQQVCEAVQHAHQKGFIHRDLKPSNVLVTQQGGRPLPKVIDFGLAKLAATDTADAQLTEIGMMLGTPAYASPEQMTAGGIDVDTRSDVYSLGVLLYELLTGVIPFEPAQRGAAAMVEMRRSIRDAEPPRPSARFAQLGTRSSQIAARRATDPDSLRRQLRGDLDWIVLKSLEKAPTSRYDSPGELSRDVSRYLQHEPVLASPPSGTYRFTKFVRRHWVGSAFVVTLLGIGVAFAVVTSMQLERTAAERDRASVEAAKANAINAFLLETLGSADPWRTGANMSVRDTLKRASDNVATTFKDQPLIAASVQETIARTYVALGRFDDADPLLAAAMAERTKRSGPRSLEVAEVRADRVALLQARSQFTQAVQEAREVLELRRSLLGSEHALVADSVLALGIALDAKGDYVEANRLTTEALTMRERLFGRDSVEVADALTRLGNVLMNGQGNYAEAEKIYARSYEIYQRHLGQVDLHTAQAEANVAAAYYFLQKFDRAEPLFRQSMDVNARLLGKDNPQTLIAMQGLAGALNGLMRYDESLALMQEVLKVRRTVLGDNHPDVSRTMVNIAQVMASAGRLEDSRAAFAEAVPLFAKAYGEKHPQYALVLLMYSGALLPTGNYAEAERVARQALAIEATTMPPDHPQVARTRMSLAMALTAQAQFAEAESLLLSARPTVEKALGAGTPKGQAPAKALVALYTAWGKPEKAAAIRAEIAAAK